MFPMAAMALSTYRYPTVVTLPATDPAGDLLVTVEALLLRNTAKHVMAASALRVIIELSVHSRQGLSGVDWARRQRTQKQNEQR